LAHTWFKSQSRENYPNWGFLLFPSASLGKYPGIASRLGTITSFHILSASSVISSPNAIRVVLKVMPMIDFDRFCKHNETRHYLANSCIPNISTLHVHQYLPTVHCDIMFCQHVQTELLIKENNSAAQYLCSALSCLW
jgi:hypothetical protein